MAEGAPAGDRKMAAVFMISTSTLAIGNPLTTQMIHSSTLDSDSAPIALPSRTWTCPPGAGLALQELDLALQSFDLAVGPTPRRERVWSPIKKRSVRDSICRAPNDWRQILAHWIIVS